MTDTDVRDHARDDPLALEPTVLPVNVEIPESPSYRVKRTLLGRPLVTEQLQTEKLSNPTALGILGIDMISSSAYGSEQMLTQLVPYFGLVGFMLIMPITGVILGLMILLTFCYRDLITHYTKAGGSYVVAREQFGVKVAQVAAVALLIDYVVTVAVQTAAGTDAIASWLTFTYGVNIDSWKIWISIAVVLILAYGNLRGIREAGRSFALPAYFYITLAVATVGLGLIQLATGNLHQAGNLHDQNAANPVLDLGTHGSQSLLVFAAMAALLRGFANGGSSLTGLEAISNSVSVFRDPAGVNARRTMTVVVTILGSLVLGISILAWQAQTMPYAGGNPTVISQLTRLIWGNGAVGTVMLTAVQLATALILYTGGNTSFSGFPFLASFVAEDSFLPRQLTIRGHRLAFSNGIAILTVLSLALLIATRGNLTSLVALYAIGVFTGFVMAAAGMFRHHLHHREPHRRLRLVVNACAAVASAIVVLIFATFKFTEGAWLVVVVFPIGVFALIRTNDRYRAEAEALAGAPASASLPTRSRTSTLILVDSIDLSVVKALRYARAQRPARLRAVHLMVDSRHAEELRRAWEASQAADIPLEIVEVPDRRLKRAAAELAAREACDGETEVTVLLPRRIYSAIVGRLLHDRTADRIAEALSPLPHVSAMIVPFDVVEAIAEHRNGKDAGIPPAPAGPAHVSRSRRESRGRSTAPVEGDEAGNPDTVQSIGRVQWRRRATVEGRVRSVHTVGISSAASLECELIDDTGGIAVVFFGRRQIAGIEPGIRMRVTGTVGQQAGRLAMCNPTYVLLPHDEHV
ncbi:MAG: amino acid permease [Catenulispora sp.]|nr:amino acid permease [Catenulispora sp.]